MSKSGMAEAMMTWEAAERERVYAETWGHLAPAKGRTYPATIVFCKTTYGDYSLIQDNLPNSPWMYSALQDFIADNAGDDGEILKFVGTFRNYKFTGKITKIAV